MWKIRATPVRRMSSVCLEMWTARQQRAAHCLGLPASVRSSTLSFLTDFYSKPVELNRKLSLKLKTGENKPPSRTDKLIKSKTSCWCWFEVFRRGELMSERTEFGKFTPTELHAFGTNGLRQGGGSGPALHRQVGKSPSKWCPLKHKVYKTVTKRSWNFIKI